MRKLYYFLIFLGFLVGNSSSTFAQTLKNNEVVGDTLHPIHNVIPQVSSLINQYPFYFLFFFLGGLVLIAGVRLLAPTYFKELFSSVFNLKLQLTSFEEGKFGFNVINLLLDLLSIAMISLFIQNYFFLLEDKLGWIIAFVALAYFFKLIFIQFFANVFFGKGEAMLHLLLHLLLTRILGILLLPLLFISLYQGFFDVHTVLGYIFSFSAFLYALWFIRLFIKMKSLTLSGIFYVFLYLCTVEVSPLVILLKDYIH